MTAKVNQESKPEVFISHSHSDREEALHLDFLLKANGATTFLDQDEIRGGIKLPHAIQDGIARCDKFLLVWSRTAAASKWVQMEWQFALLFGKGIIPYMVDSSTLPNALKDFVHVNPDDKEHGHAELFRAVFGRLLKNPKGVDIFAGHWVATVYQGGTGNQGVARLELRPNGQVRGDSQIKKTGGIGLIGHIIGNSPYGYLGVTDLFFRRVPLKGRWSYTSGGGLRLELEQSSMGQVISKEVTVHTRGKKKDALHGLDEDGNMWTLRRAPDEEEDAESDEELDEELDEESDEESGEELDED